MDIHLEGRCAKRDDGRNHLRDEPSKMLTQPARGSAKELNQNGTAGRTEKCSIALRQASTKKTALTIVFNKVNAYQNKAFQDGKNS